MSPVIKAIDIALENELKERDFYLQNAQRTQSPVGKKMFETIAADEDEHYKRFKLLHENMGQGSTWPDKVSSIINDTNVMEVIKEIPNVKTETSQADADDIQAVKVAIEFESNGYSFYTDIANQCETEQERAFFSKLASVEKEHLDSLKDTLLFFEDPATWYEENEKGLLEG